MLKTKTKTITNKEWWALPENVFYGRYIEDDEGNTMINPLLCEGEDEDEDEDEKIF